MEHLRHTLARLRLRSIIRRRQYHQRHCSNPFDLQPLKAATFAPSFPAPIMTQPTMPAGIPVRNAARTSIAALSWRRIAKWSMVSNYHRGGRETCSLFYPDSSIISFMQKRAANGHRPTYHPPLYKRVAQFLYSPVVNDARVDPDGRPWWLTPLVRP